MMSHTDDDNREDALDRYVASRRARDPEFAREYDALGPEYERKNQEIEREVARSKTSGDKRQEE